MSEGGKGLGKGGSNAYSVVLHLYDHCPFCIRVDLALGWAKVNYQRKLYGYGDIEGPKALTGEKVLPVLELNDKQTGEKQLLRESLDIIGKLNADGWLEENPLSPRSVDETLKKWESEFQPLHQTLTRPRVIKLPPEVAVDFATEADRTYQMNKYTKKGFDYDAAWAKSDETKEAVAKSLNRLAEILEERNESSSTLTLSGGEKYDMNDCIYLPDLRRLTCVKEVKWPPIVRKYVDDACKAAGVVTYDSWSC